MDPIATLALKLAPFAIAAVVGAGMAEGYEHKAPWGLGPTRARLEASIPALEKTASQQGATAQAALDKAAFDDWSTQLASCRADATTARDALAAAQSRADAFTSTQSSAAFRLGRASCGGTHATTTPGTTGGPASGGLRGDDDFGAVFGSAAFTAPGKAALPGGGGQPRP